jgi:hypothetical protein
MVNVTPATADCARKAGHRRLDQYKHLDARSNIVCANTTAWYFREA